MDDLLRWRILPLLVVLVASLVIYIRIPPKNSVSECSLLPYDHFWITSKQIVTPQGVIKGAVEVKDGKIVSVVQAENQKSLLSGGKVVDYGEAVIMPGLIDVHAHLDEPGRVEWEGFSSGTKAAAAGGITTLIDMPLNSFPSTVSEETLRMKVEAAQKKIYVDVGFWGGLVPENAFNLSMLDGLLRAGALGLKSFMCPSGINDFPMTNSTHIKEVNQLLFDSCKTEIMPGLSFRSDTSSSSSCNAAFDMHFANNNNEAAFTICTDREEGLYVLAKYKRPLLVHAEVVLESGSNDDQFVGSSNPRSYATYLKTRPATWEEAAIKNIQVAIQDTRAGGQAAGAHVHIVHLSDAKASLDLIKDSKRNGLTGVSVSVETCPHYLAFSAEEIPDGDTRFKCAPPIREAENREKLWEALMEGHIDMLSSDHSPSVPELKLFGEGDFLRAWGGISSLQYVLPITWTYGLRYGVSFSQIATWWSERPAMLAGQKYKGAIIKGNDADFAIWKPEVEFDLDENYKTFHKHPSISPYIGRRLSGQVIATFVRGNLVFSEGTHAPAACGAPLLAK